MVGVEVPLGSYHVPFVGYLMLGSGSYSRKVKYPIEMAWYEPTGMASIGRCTPESFKLTLQTD